MPHSKVILCVDDEPTGLQVRALVLSSAGYSVLTARSGKAGFDMFLLNRVDLVIVDYFLPDIAGTELISRIKSIRPEVPAVLLTGLPEQPPGDHEADLFITKGISPHEFLARIQELIARSRRSSDD